MCRRRHRSTRRRRRSLMDGMTFFPFLFRRSFRDPTGNSWLGRIMRQRHLLSGRALQGIRLWHGTGQQDLHMSGWDGSAVRPDE